MHQPWQTRHSIVMIKHWVMSLTTGRVCMGTRQAISLHRRNAAEEETGMIKICATSSTTEMHVAESKISVRSMSALNRSSMKKETMTTMVSIMTNLINSVFLKGGGGTMQDKSWPFPTT
jgi:hypothetical protein